MTNITMRSLQEIGGRNNWRDEFSAASRYSYPFRPMRFKPRLSVVLYNRRKLQKYRGDREGTVPTAIKTSTFRDLLQDNRSLPPTKILVEPQRTSA